MNYLEAVLIANSRRVGRAQRSASFRHRHLVRRPMGMVLWQLGAEPFTAAGIAWGFRERDRNLVVPGEPRDRDLAFRALTEVARVFNRWFENEHGQDAPQLIIPNRATLTLLRRLGRRLAYLPTDGAQPADPELVKFGRHLQFLSNRARHPGQQLIVVLTELLAFHWITELSDLENQNLPALDAAIDPPDGLTGHQAALLAEQMDIGPAPTKEDDDKLEVLLTIFNAARNRRTEERVVAPLRGPIREHYESLVFERGWPLLWRRLERERTFGEAPHVARRWKDDVEAFGAHLEWVVVKGGRYRTRDTHARAAWTLRAWEEAERTLVAEEALDDPLRMIPFFLSDEAIGGIVTNVDAAHRVWTGKRNMARPLVTIETADPCRIPVGTELYWTRAPEGREYTVVEVKPAKKGGSLVTLQLATSAACERPRVGRQVVFSIHHLHAAPYLQLPDSAPWTHTQPAVVGAPIEEPRDARGWE